MMRFTASLLLALSAVVLPAPDSQADDYVWLFDGTSTDAWMTPGGKPAPAGWRIQDGALHLNRDAGPGGNLVTVEEFSDYELHFDWKIEPGGNNGVKYRVRKFGKRILGCEYQILDDSKHRDALTDKKSTGSLYDLYAPVSTKYVKPLDEFNYSRVVVYGNRIQHWLNGELILCTCVGSPDWYQKKNDSKFKDVDGFGENRYGRIMLTDHHSQVWFKNIVVRRLGPTRGAPIETAKSSSPVTVRVVGSN